MSATMHPPYTAPGIQDQSPWAQALAGGGQQRGATMFDTGSNQLPGGFNPWANYNTPQDNGQFNYSQDPYFNAAADKPTWDLAQAGQGSETDRARVWRWTLDQLKAQGLDPGSAPQATVQQAYLANIARLKRDYAANGMNWQGSAFAGYDQFLGGGQPGATQQGGARGQGDWSGQTAPGTMVTDYEPGYGPNGQQGGSGMANPPYGQGAATGASAAGVTTQPGGSGTQGGGGQITGGGTSSPNGGTSTILGNFGQLQNFDPTYAAQAASNDPGIAAHYLRLAQGQTGPITTRLGKFRDSLYGQALQALLALNGVGGGGGSMGDDMQGFLSALNSGNIGGLLNSTAARASGADFTGQQDTDIEKVLRAALALRGVTTGSLGSAMAGNDLDNLLYSQEGAGLQSNGVDNTGLGARLRSDQYGQSLNQYLANR